MVFPSSDSECLYILQLPFLLLTHFLPPPLYIVILDNPLYWIYVSSSFYVPVDSHYWMRFSDKTLHDKCIANMIKSHVKDSRVPNIIQILSLHKSVFQVLIVIVIRTTRDFLAKSN